MMATQLGFFGEETPARSNARPRFVRVLRDPDVVAAMYRRASQGCDLRSAFVGFWAALPPEKRAELKARLAA